MVDFGLSKTKNLPAMKGKVMVSLFVALCHFGERVPIISVTFDRYSPVRNGEVNKIRAIRKLGNKIYMSLLETLTHFLFNHTFGHADQDGTAPSGTSFAFVFEVRSYLKRLVADLTYDYGATLKRPVCAGRRAVTLCYSFWLKCLFAGEAHYLFRRLSYSITLLFVTTGGRATSLGAGRSCYKFLSAVFTVVLCGFKHLFGMTYVLTRTRAISRMILIRFYMVDPFASLANLFDRPSNSVLATLWPSHAVMVTLKRNRVNGVLLRRYCHV